MQVGDAKKATTPKIQKVATQKSTDESIKGSTRKKTMGKKKNKSPYPVDENVSNCNLLCQTSTEIM